jgi:PAT family beta-lactamase induction signal transducer AmpG
LWDRRHLTILMLGFSSGFPWVLHGSVLTLWLQETGLSRSTIGFVGAIGVIYAFKWIWSPLVDEWQLPWLHRRYGRRRSWILLMQAAILVSMLLLSYADPALSLVPVTVFALAIAVCSATLDIAVDAYRITIFSESEYAEKMPYAAAMATTGWWAGYGFLGGTLALWLGGENSGLAWPLVYRWLTLIYIVLMVLVCLVPEPADNGGTTVRPRPDGSDLMPISEKIKHWLSGNVLEPFVEFFRRCGTQLGIAILAFLLLFKLGEGMLGRMSLVFYVELGFSTDQIAWYHKFSGGLMTAVFSLLGAFVNVRFGVIRGLLIGGVTMAAANLLYAVMATVGPEPALFLFTLLVDNFCGAFATVAAISFMSYFTSRTYTGTQFALMTAISNFGRTSLAATSGMLVDSLHGDWAWFFVLTMLMVIPSLCLLGRIDRLLKTHN